MASKEEYEFVTYLEKNFNNSNLAKIQHKWNTTIYNSDALKFGPRKLIQPDCVIQLPPKSVFEVGERIAIYYNGW